MFNVDAAQLITIVLAAGSLLLAAFLAARIIGFACQVLAINLAVHVTATALDISVQVTFRAFPHVTRCFADVRITCVNEQKFDLARLYDKTQSSIKNTKPY